VKLEATVSTRGFGSDGIVVSEIVRGATTRSTTVTSSDGMVESKRQNRMQRKKTSSALGMYM
jgi:hypothetical protein